jgi:hypothetical protein
MFRAGELFEHSFRTSGGEIGLLAEVRILADTLWLKDIAVYPVHGEKLIVGSTEVKKCLSQLEGMARTNSFRRLRITGKRVSGAAKGRQVDLMRIL